MANRIKCQWCEKDFAKRKDGLPQAHNCEPTYIEVQVLRGRTGSALLVNGRRVTEEKMWGGGEITHTFHIMKSELRAALG